MTEKLKLTVACGVNPTSLGEHWWSKLEEMTEEIVEVADEGDLPSKIGEAEGLLLSLGKGADASLIEAASSLRYIGMLGTGYGRIDIETARSANVTVTNIADYSTEGVAEFVFGALISEMRELERARNQARSLNYDESSFTGTQLSSRSFGVLGLGHIGRRVAEIAANGFGAEVSYWSRSEKDLSGVPKVKRLDTPEQVLSNCDVISLHLEHNPETDGFLDAERLRLIPDGALVINTAPWELVDLEALEEELQAGRFSFILDHSDEMEPDDVARLVGYEKCVVYPPIAYTTAESTEAKKEIFVGNLRSFLEGGRQNVVS